MGPDEAAKPDRSESAWLAGVLSDKKCRSDEYAAAMERRLAIEPRKPTREELHDRTGLR